MLHRLFVHIVWTTRDRERSIDPDSADLLRELLPRIARQERATVLEIGIVRTHVHLLLRVHPTTALPRLLQRLKGGTSVIVNQERGNRSPGQLRWAKGYSITTVSPRHLPAVRDYVHSQARIHPDEALAKRIHG